MRKRRNWLPLLAVLVMAVLAMTTGAFAAGEEAAEYISPFHATAWSLLPPVIAIGLALITKEQSVQTRWCNGRIYDDR